MRSFSHFNAQSIKEACKLLAEYDGRCGRGSPCRRQTSEHERLQDRDRQDACQKSHPAKPGSLRKARLVDR